MHAEVHENERMGLVGVLLEIIILLFELILRKSWKQGGHAPC